MKESRDTGGNWIDCAKGIGILLVVYGHVARGLVSSGIMTDDDIYRAVDAAIYAFHMPLFFFLSGLFFLPSLKRRGRKGLFFNKVDTILYIYVLWSVLQGSIEASLSSVTNGSASWADVPASIWLPRGQFWYLYALFLIFTLSVLLYRGSSKVSLFVGIAVGAAAYFTQDLYVAPPQFGYVANNLIFFAIGIGSTNLLQHVAVASLRRLLLSAALFATIQVLCHWAYGFDRTHGDWRALLFATLGIATVLCSAAGLAKAGQRWLAFLGTMSMSVFLMHIIAGSGVRVLLSKFAGVDNQWVHLIAGFSGAVLLPLAGAYILPRVGGSFLFGPPRWLTFGSKRPSAGDFGAQVPRKQVSPRTRT